MPRPLFCRAALLAAGAMLLAACAQAPKVDGRWNDQADRGQPFSRVMVVGVTPHLNQRCAFEGFLADRIRSDATQVVTSCGTLPHGEKLTRESVERVVAEQGVDGVLATTLVAVKQKAQEGGTIETRGDAYYKATDFGYAAGYYGYYGVYGVPMAYAEFETAPALTTVRGDITVSTTLYSTRNAMPVYTITTRARGLESRAEGLAVISGPIAERLRRDGVIR